MNLCPFIIIIVELSHAIDWKCGDGCRVMAPREIPAQVLGPGTLGPRMVRGLHR